MQKIADARQNKPLTIIATGRFIGEGFDEPRLDTLFLAMPISWKGTLQQYAGRLHRLFEGKKEALIFDYIDIHVRMFERMYNRRLSGYASIGYKMKGELFPKQHKKRKTWTSFSIKVISIRFFKRYKPCNPRNPDCKSVCYQTKDTANHAKFGTCPCKKSESYCGNPSF
jgi:superfamily II DNA or RNA helicase